MGPGSTATPVHLGRISRYIGLGVRDGKRFEVQSGLGTALGKGSDGLQYRATRPTQLGRMSLDRERGTPSFRVLQCIQFGLFAKESSSTSASKRRQQVAGNKSFRGSLNESH